MRTDLANNSDMSSTENPVVSVEPSPTSQPEVPNSHLEVPTQKNRKIGIIHGLHAHDNSGFESPRNRKVSSNAEHAGMGPVRKKSILHNAHYNSENTSVGGHSDGGKQTNGDLRIKKPSTTESVHSKSTRFSDVVEVEGGTESWWYALCLKCRENETHPSWYPPIWPKLCPYPFCPTYRQFSRIISILLIGTITWCVVYSIVGDTAAPGGQLFQLMVLAICAHLVGWLMSLTTLPALVGMLFTGLLFQNVGFVDIDESFSEITKEIRSIALVIILIRAGLDLDPSALKRLKFAVIKLSLGPWLVEAGMVIVLSHFLLGLAWDYAVILGTLIAAVSPGVVVPCLFRLRSKGYGVAKGIPTLIIAVAGINDAVSVAAFGIVKSIMFSNDSLLFQVLQGPISVVGGMGFGIVWGFLCKYIPERRDPFLVPLRILLLLMGGMIAVYGSEMIGYGGAGPLGCVTAAFVCFYFWSEQGWEIEDNPAATAFEIFWMIFEPILFSVTGTQIKLNELDGNIVAIGLGILIGSVAVRIVITMLLGIGCQLNMKEKIFVSLAWMSKAIVQAALGPATLAVVEKDTPEYDYAEKILMICVLSIILTAPTGAFSMILGGPRLLTKTRVPVALPGWKRSRRPSMRDISIIDESEKKDNVENTNVKTV